MLQTLTLPGATSDDFFGSTVAISDAVVFVGAPGFETRGSRVTNHGSVFVFTLSGSTYTLSATLTDSAPTASDQFGFTASSKLSWLDPRPGIPYPLG